MGRNRISVLHVEEIARWEDNIKECGLWSRGGLNGVEVHIGNKIISIPREELLKIIASEYVSNQVSKYEQMNVAEAIFDMMDK